jgi:hypothetical protein
MLSFAASVKAIVVSEKYDNSKEVVINFVD